MSSDLQEEVQNKIYDVVSALLAARWYLSPGWGQQPKTEPDLWTTAEILYVFNEIKDKKRPELGRANAVLLDNSAKINAAREYVVGQQLDDKGWGFMGESRTTDTAFAMLVLSQQDPEANLKQIREGLKYLYDERNYDTEMNDGGWPVSPRGQSSINATSLVLMCLDIVQDNIGPNRIYVELLKPASTFIMRRQNPDGGWGEWWGDPSETKATAYAVYALGRVFRTKENVQVARRNGMKWIKGSWNAGPGHWGTGNGDVVATAMAILALLAAGESPRSACITKSLKYLLGAENRTSGWGQQPNAKIETWVTYYVLLALINYLDACRSRNQIRPLEALRNLLYNRAFTNLLMISLLLIAFGLLVVSLLASDQLRSALTLISAIMGLIGVLIPILRFIIAGIRD